jgi:twitching motility protein PilT
MVKTPYIAQLILESRDVEIRDAIEEGREIYGSQSFDQHLLDLWRQKIISTEQAFNYATSPSDLKLKMEGMGGKISASPKSGENEKAFEEDEIFQIKQ